MVLSLPAVLLLAAQSGVPIPDTVEVRPGVYVVQGAPTDATFAALKAAGISRVINLRLDGEGDFAAQRRAAEQAGAAYERCPVGREPAPEALDAFRARMRALPPGSGVLVHCASGNRAAGALYAYWVLDEGMSEPQALAFARKAGLSQPATEAAVKAYVAARRAK